MIWYNESPKKRLEGMFGKSTEKRVIRDADKIVSLKDDIDALSWGRVLELGKLLKGGSTDIEYAECGRELVVIAQSNLSLKARLGIVDHPAQDESISHTFMASGLEVMEGGLAQAAIELKSDAKGHSEISEQRLTTESDKDFDAEDVVFAQGASLSSHPSKKPDAYADFIIATEEPLPFSVAPHQPRAEKTFLPSDASSDANQKNRPFTKSDSSHESSSDSVCSESESKFASPLPAKHVQQANSQDRVAPATKEHTEEPIDDSHTIPTRWSDPARLRQKRPVRSDESSPQNDAPSNHEGISREESSPSSPLISEAMSGEGESTGVRSVDRSLDCPIVASPSPTDWGSFLDATDTITHEVDTFASDAPIKDGASFEGAAQKSADMQAAPVVMPVASSAPVVIPPPAPATPAATASIPVAAPAETAPAPAATAGTPTLSPAAPAETASIPVARPAASLTSTSDAACASASSSSTERSPGRRPHSDKRPFAPRHERLSRFQHLYESRDGGLCVFLDENGHLVAVNASKLS